MKSRHFPYAATRSVCQALALAICMVVTSGGLVSAQDAAKLERLINRDDAESARKVILTGPANLLTANLPASKLTPLYFAIQKKKVESVKMLIGLDAPLVSSHRRKLSSLHLAISGRNLEIIKSIINKADDVDFRDRNSATPLMYTVMYKAGNSIELIDLLVAKGADLEATNSNQQTALHLACHYGRTEIAKHLVELGANVAVVDKQGMTPLLAACSREVSLVELLLETGADPLVRSLRGDSALHLACNSNRPKVAERINQYFNDVDVLNGQFQTPLLIAVMRGNVPTAKLLIERGADVNRFDSARANQQSGTQAYWPLLIYPAATGQTELLKLLIDSGASIDEKDPTGNSALHAAVNGGANQLRFASDSRNGQSKLNPAEPFLKNIELLVAAQADANAKNNDGTTPIQIAAQQDFFDAVEVLVEQSEVLDFEVGNGRLIHWAAQNGLAKTMKRLFETNRKADEILDDLKRTPLHHAAANGNAAIVEMLIKQGFDPSAKDIDGLTPLMLAATEGHADVVQVLINSGVHMEADASGQTAVHLAAWSGASDVIAIFAKTTDVAGLKTNTGYTPQHAAAWQGHADVVSQLVTAGADPNAADSDGWTPLHKAAFRGHVDVVKVLLEKGADRSLKTGAGLTAISMAEGNKKAEVVLLLK